MCLFGVCSYKTFRDAVSFCNHFDLGHFHAFLLSVYTYGTKTFTNVAKTIPIHIQCNKPKLLL